MARIYTFSSDRFRPSQIDFEEIRDNETAIDYLLGYGYSQSMQDKIAGQVKARKDKLTPKAEAYIKANIAKGMTVAEQNEVRATAAAMFGYEYATEYAKAPDGEELLAKPIAFDESRITAEINKMLDSRHDDILAGLVNTRAAAAPPKMDRVTKHMMEAAKVAVLAAIAAKGLEVSETDIEVYTEKYFAAHFAALQAAAEEALKPRTAEAKKGLSLDDLFDAPEAVELTDEEQVA